MQDTDKIMSDNCVQRDRSSPYNKYDSPTSSRASSPVPTDVDAKYASDDEISVGCPSPALNSPKNFSRENSQHFSSNSRDMDYSKSECNDESSCRCKEEPEDYFKPLKRLKMVHIQSDRRLSPTIELEDRTDGVKSFSIADILNHRPSKSVSNRIVRPWDPDPETEAQQNLERLHRHFKVQQQMAMLRQDYATTFGQSYTSETGSDRSSSVTSDCCSPDIVTTARQRQQQQQQQKTPGSTPLDALFQMTSKTFDSNQGEGSADGQNHLNLFNNRQQPKKKRKSRTAFTNHQIFELEKRFLYQKYLSPADRDEIASSLSLSNAQVITWFQNRRAKLKRDMEELKKDVESAKILTAHKSFLENVQDLGILKKKAVVGGEDCKGIMISPEK